MEEKQRQNILDPYMWSMGSHCELETQVGLSGDLGYIKTEELKKICNDIGGVERMLKSLIKSLENKHLNP